MDNIDYLTWAEAHLLNATADAAGGSEGRRGRTIDLARSGAPPVGLGALVHDHEDPAATAGGPEGHGSTAIGQRDTKSTPSGPDRDLAVLDLDDVHAPVHFAAELARRYGLAENCVLPTFGTSQALHCALAAVCPTPGRVVIERPCYEPLWRVAAGLGQRVSFWDRRPDTEAPDLDELAALLGPDTHAVVVTTPHNPTGQILDPAWLGAARNLCAARGKTLIVDEVYSEVFAPGTSAFQLGGPIIAVSSMTKTWGLPWARVGWLLAQPEVVEAARVPLRHTTAYNGTMSAAIGLRALAIAPALLSRVRQMIVGKSAIVDAWIQQQPALSWYTHSSGPIGLIRHDGKDAERTIAAALDRAERERGVKAVPGHFFGEPGSFRLAMFPEASELRRGLEVLGEFLDDEAAKN